jgi:2,5-dihydroxypyridine 5,6-dioxygenase
MCLAAARCSPVLTDKPVRLTMKEGYCVAIEGGIDATLLRDYMASFNDPEAYAMSHIGWGLQPLEATA